MEENIDFEISCDVPFDNGQAYIVGFDSFGAGLCFDSAISVCRNKQEIEEEIYRVIEENGLAENYPLESDDDITVEEAVVIAQLVETPNLNYREFEVQTIKTYK